jgi:CBS domain-containing protein
MNALLCIEPAAVYDRLVPTVGEIMTPDVLGLEPATSLVDAARRMHERRVGAVVVTERDRLVGIVTERDILRAVATGVIDGSVGDAMTHGPDTIGPDESAGHQGALNIPGGIEHLQVVT